MDDSLAHASNLESLPINMFFKKERDPKMWLPAFFYPYQVYDTHTFNYTNVYLNGLDYIRKSPLATQKQRRIATRLHTHVSRNHFLAVFAFIQPARAQISRRDASMALLREPPILSVELPEETEGVGPHDDQAGVEVHGGQEGDVRNGGQLDQEGGALHGGQAEGEVAVLVAANGVVHDEQAPDTWSSSVTLLPTPPHES
ncbi:hypothetical protein BGZ52_004902 [Haplosporangium bisporale]|nr:hypothetical protein BGZ52_004902 [Haplosporangium bisporale]KFH67053.1 hypothetical protein MVEG_07576 [Podila verticillata NRRL 6337]